jgi:hypothetical protein
MATQIERNAEVVADLAGSDWQMAYVIACSVEYRGRNGKGLDANSHPDKVTAAEFARLVKGAGGPVYGMGQKAIAARLVKWDEFREQQDWDIPASADLTPADANTYPPFPDIPFSREDGAAGQDESNKGKVRDIANNPRSNAIALSDEAARGKVIDELTPQAASDLVEDIISKGKLTPQVSQKMQDHYEEKKKSKDRQKDHEMTRVSWFADIMLRIGEAEKRSWGRRALMDVRDEIDMRLGLDKVSDLTPEMFNSN